MSISQPSKEIYSVDIPETKNFSAEFMYNFFTKDESVNDSGNVPTSVLQRNSTSIDTSFVQYATVRAPRFVKFAWKPVYVTSAGRQTTDTDIRANSFESGDVRGIISSNLDKIVTEDRFASYDYISVNFHDSKIDEKVYQLVSGSYEQHTLGQENSKNLTLLRSANLLKSLLPVQNGNGTDLVKKSLGSPVLGAGINFTAIDSGANKQTRTFNASTNAAIKQAVVKSNRKRLLLLPKFFLRLKHVNIDTQINSKFLSDLTNRAINDPTNTLSTDLASMKQFATSIQRYARDRNNLSVNESDFQTNVPFIDLNVTKSSHLSQGQQVGIVGYVIDKIEVFSDGTTKQHHPIIVEGTNTALAIDFQVKYGSTYKYTIRSIAKITIPAVDIDTGDIASLTLLVSSRPSTVLNVEATERVAPPPPTNLSFIWNYERDKMMLLWNFPNNPQQDIKKFQVFRRKSIHHPYELLKMYDFNDSVVRISDKENPSPMLVEFLSSPSSTYIDDDFTMDSKYIYAVAAVDAHGLTSNYSEQFEVSFDKFKNKIIKSLISHSGAPKPYPNLYLEEDMFVDTIKVSGASSKRMKVYLNPEHFSVVDDESRVKSRLQTNQSKGSYTIQFLNVDNQKSATLDITIDDRTSRFNKKLAVATKSYFGKRQKVSTKSDS